MGDFNAHNQIWNCHSTDINGERLYEEMENKDMWIINKDTLTRIGEGGKRASNLDLMFCSNDIFMI